MPFKKSKVVMLPTKEKAIKNQILLGLYDNEANGMVYSKLIQNFHCDSILGGYYKPQHLYFLSDEEIKEGDYWIYLHEFPIPQNFTITKNNLPKEWFEKLWDRINYKKIIASTDPSLNLPQPSDSFIKKYIEKWNKGEKIEEVEIEYDLKSTIPFSASCPDRDRGYIEYLKVNSKDNTITIRSIKNSWTREEVIAFGSNCFNLGVKRETFDEEWINKNL